MVVLVKKLLSVCCGDHEVLSSLIGKWAKKPGQQHDDDDDVDAEEFKRNDIKHPKKQRGTFTDKEMKYELTFWKDLPLKIRRAVEDLGGNKEMWDHSERFHVDDKHWHDLTEKELRAAELMGWDKESWDHQWEHTEWEDLPPVCQKAALTAGLTQEHWEHDHWTPNLEKRWDDLAEKDKQAMSVLGWTKHAWD